MLLKQLEQRRTKPSFFDAVSYRVPLPVAEVVVLRSGDGYCVCPRCDSLLDREYMRYCDRCGQHLAWELLDHARVVPAPRRKHEGK